MQTLMVRVLVLGTLVLCVPLISRAADPEPMFDMGGYYRVRGFSYNDPSEKFIQHRLRFEPVVRPVESLAIRMQADAMDDQVWGSNPGNVLSQSTADTKANLIVKRAWAELTTSIGMFRVGRMGSFWGRGLLANDGDNFRNEWGDAHGGDTSDRILFVTKPLGRDGPLTTAILTDKIIESQGYDALPDTRRKGDVNQHGIIVNWSDTGYRIGNYTIYRTEAKTETAVIIPNLMLGFQNDWVHASVEAVGIFGSGKSITAFYKPGQQVEDEKGTLQTIRPFTLDQPEVKIRMKAYSGEVGVTPLEGLDIAIEQGYASGDEAGVNVFRDRTLSGYTANREYNVGLLMFEDANRLRTAAELAAINKQFNTEVEGGTLSEICATTCVNKTPYPSSKAALNQFLNSTAAVFTPSNGSLRNAIYAFPKVRYQAAKDLKLTIGVLWAQTDVPVQDLSDPNNEKATVTDYGVEVDAGIDYLAVESLRLGIQSGILFPGDVFKQANGKPAPNLFSVQPRLTVLF